uniref:Uncharacterized protein n=1 Tax=Arundo donax TaxID=35708 RepID=A0A0A9E3B9_ARUDO
MLRPRISDKAGSLHGFRDAVEHVDLGAQVDDVVHGFTEQRGLVHGAVPTGYHLPECHGPPHQPPRDLAARGRRTSSSSIAASLLLVDAPPHYSLAPAPHLARVRVGHGGGGGQDGLGPPRAGAARGGHGDVGGGLDGALPLVEAHGVEAGARLHARPEAQEQVLEEVLLEGHGAFACASVRTLHRFLILAKDRIGKM